MTTLRRVLAAEERGLTRALGGVLIAAGGVVLVLRRTSFGDPWGEFVVFLILAALAESLFWSGFFGARASDSTRPWPTVFMIAGIGLTPLALFQFVELVDGDTGAALNVAWIFLLTSVVAAAALYGARLRIAALLAAVALVVAWVGLWEEFLDEGVLRAEYQTFGDAVEPLRWVLLSAGLLLLAGAGAVSFSRAPEGAAGDVITVAGFVALLAGAVAFVFPGFFIAAEEAAFPAAGTSFFWDLELLVASLALIAYAGAGAALRGPGYVGAIGIAAFVFSVGLDLDDLSPAGKVLGWPLVLLALGALLVIASAVPQLRRRRT